MRSIARMAWSVALVLSLSATALAGGLEVRTAQGKVRGRSISDGRVNAFLGLPYAAPPTGERRWRAPGPPARWKGTRDATSFGARCVQGRVYSDMVFQDSGPSEDCLFLNVYVPASATRKSRLPVMFWIHGGGYAGGSASEPRHNGDLLPLKGVVLVTINYRLGVFGFLATDDLIREGNGAAGDYGLMDMIAALSWVSENIRGFGGDPGNVTIFGESAGSMAVSTLMASPLARGLFHRAIGQSGSGFPAGNAPGGSAAERARRDGEWVSSALGVSSLAELRALPAETIVAAASKQGAPGFVPDVDGRVLTEPIADTFRAGRQAHVPLLAGWNADEGSFVAAHGMTAGEWSKIAGRLFADRPAEFLRLYPGENDAQALRSAIDFGGDSFIAFSTWRWIRAHSATGQSPVYRYHLERAASPSQFHAGTFAFHSDDIEYVFGTLDTRPGWNVQPEDRTLSSQMMSYWTNFARTGDPNGPGLPLWPRFGANDELIHLNVPITAGPDTLRARYEFLLDGGVPRLQF